MDPISSVHMGTNGQMEYRSQTLFVDQKIQKITKNLKFLSDLSSRKKHTAKPHYKNCISSVIYTIINGYRT